MNSATSGKNRSPGRHARLAAALRDNLKKRKTPQPAAARGAGDTEEPGPDSPPIPAADTKSR